VKVLLSPLEDLPVPDDVTGDLVPEVLGLELGQPREGFLVVLIIVVELVRIPLEQFDRGPLDVSGSNISHAFHLVKGPIGIPIFICFSVKGRGLRAFNL